VRRILSPTNILLVLAGLGVLAYYGSFVLTEYLWFASQGYESVFVTTVLSRLAVGAAAGLATFIFMLMNLLIARREGAPGSFEYLLGGDMEVSVSLPPRLVRALTVLVPLAVGVLVGVGAAGGWLTVRKYLSATPFDLSDPLFGRDIGFYVFELPFFRWLYGGAMAVLVLTFGATVLYYLANRGLDIIRGRPVFSSRAWTHLSFLLALILLLKAVGYRLAQFNLLYSPRGVAFGASYTDIHAQLPALGIMSVLAVAVALLLAVNGRLRRLNLVLWSLGFLVAASFVLGTAYPAFVQQFTVEPDELNTEMPYIKHNIAMTRAAFDLDRVVEREFPALENLTLADIQEESATIGNIRLWDWRPLRETYGQLQAIRPYYDFADVDVDRYVVDGRYRQVTLAAREINYDLIPEQARTWLNLHLKYTHGYGVVMSPTTEATGQGLPTFYVKDIPPVVTVSGLEVTKPQIYFGELTNIYSIVNHRDLEFDYPMGQENRYYTYTGTGGVQLSNPLVRAAFAIRLGSYQILLADAITDESRVLIYRNIHELVRKLAPWLSYDRDPYLVVGDDGRLFYIQDAYTVTNLFPYSEPHAGINYIRNPVKVTIDAYHGTATFYLFDESEPIARTLSKIFPDLFTPADEMPADVRAHVRYPEDLFSIQADVYAMYHMQDPVVFYNREDVWERPIQIYTDAGAPGRTGGAAGARVEPHYMILRLPGEEREELVQMLPFSPREKNNMIAWLAARSDGDRYGELVVFTFPKEKLVLGPRQVEARIDQDTFISQRLTLWDQAGSSVIRGTLLVIPIKDSILYVEPLYLQAAGNRLPELKRVIVAYGDEVVMSETLSGALSAIFGGAVGPPDGMPDTVPGAPATVLELARRAGEIYDLMTEATSRGDWAAYGRHLAELEQVLTELERLAAQSGEGGP